MSQIIDTKKRYRFSKPPFEAIYPDLLTFQYRKSKSLFQPGKFSEKDKEKSELYKIFSQHFPVVSNKEHFKVEFLGYTMAEPIYTPEECIDKALTYEAAVTIRLRLIYNEDDVEEIIEEDVFFAELPCMTSQGSFIFKGIERVIIGQLLRSAGLFFSQVKHINGIDLYTAKIIPVSGSWCEFSLDTHGILYVYLDRRRKIPVTLLLRAMGYSTDKDILQLFDLVETVKATKQELAKHKGRTIGGRILKIWVEEFVDNETGEVIPINRHEVVVERNTVLTDEVISIICNAKQKQVLLLKEGGQCNDFAFILRTFNKDETNSKEEAGRYIYHQFRSQDPADEQTVWDLVNEILFGSKRFYLGKVGRYCINKKLGLKIDPDNYMLTKEDIIATIKRFPDVINGRVPTEDPDSLVNRIVKTAGDVLQEAMSKGIRLTANYMREILNTRNNEDPKPVDIVSGHYIMSAINTLFNSPYCQYKDGVNPLASLEHARRFTKAMLDKKRATMDARNIHGTYQNHFCSINSSDGMGIGLNLSGTTQSLINPMGFLQTYYKKVTDGVVDFKKDHYLTADEREKVVVAQYTSEIDANGKILAKQLDVINNKGDFAQVSPDKVEYIGQSNDQSLSISGALIPFVEYTDAARATYGTAMLRQAVPLFKTEKAILATGQEKRVARDARVVPVAEEDGIVTYVDAEKIIIQKDIPEELKPLTLDTLTKTYLLTRLRPTNQKTCVHLQPTVKKGNAVKKGDFLADGYGIADGELALGTNIPMAFMSFRGYNFEDGIVVSDWVVKHDALTSLSVEKIVCNTYNTKLGPEEITRDIPGVSEKALENLDENGIIRVGTKIKENDILVGKITPQSNDNPSAESKLMAAIFGESAENVKNTSLKAPFGAQGTVVETKILHGFMKTPAERKDAKKALEQLTKATAADFDALRKKGVQALLKLVKKEKTKTIFDLNKKVFQSAGKPLTKEIIEKKIFPAIDKKQVWKFPFKEQFSDYNWTESKLKNEQITYLFASYVKAYNQLVHQIRRKRTEIQVGQGLPPGVRRQVQIYVVKKCKAEVGDKVAGRYGSKGVISAIFREEDMPIDEDGNRIHLCMSPLSISSRLNLGQPREIVLGGAGKKLGRRYEVQPFDRISMDRINKELEMAGLPAYGRKVLYDGLTGEPFDQPVTCGVIYLLKLNHRVQDKVHVRGNGPRSLMDQQPTQGRKYKGGQRCGSMERNALEGYGASGTLHELFTLKSDDMRGSREMQESIYKGRPISRSYIPESLKMLEQFCAGLCLNLEFRLK
ncbi:MAG: DNA-directed RNA polymerase subunit beta [Cytophagales bacterium]